MPLVIRTAVVQTQRRHYPNGELTALCRDSRLAPSWFRPRHRRHLDLATVEISSRPPSGGKGVMGRLLEGATATIGGRQTPLQLPSPSPRRRRSVAIIVIKLRPRRSLLAIAIFDLWLRSAISTCEKEAPQNDGDTGVVSAMGTPMLKRSSRARVLGEIRSGQLPRAPDGRLEPRPARAIGPIDWRHVGPDSTRGTEGWLSLAPAWADPARTGGGRWCSEHCFVRAYGPFRRERGTWSANDSVLDERLAIR
ncbi:hypothetical protein TIFTF001_029872 [Ficus carica]|uniref:Uncharacterized protein n=1 Tax=Ficus carica TaxID=3494 RepID=A0AA88DSA5_FICCA|nr:hypothetical protein TIFTF001_029872 [Ficus carica]